MLVAAIDRQRPAGVVGGARPVLLRRVDAGELAPSAPPRSGIARSPARARARASSTSPLFARPHGLVDAVPHGPVSERDADRCVGHGVARCRAAGARAARPASNIRIGPTPAGTPASSWTWNGRARGIVDDHLPGRPTDDDDVVEPSGTIFDQRDRRAGALRGCARSAPVAVERPACQPRSVRTAIRSSPRCPGALVDQRREALGVNAGGSPDSASPWPRRRRRRALRSGERRERRAAGAERQAQRAGRTRAPPPRPASRQRRSRRRTIVNRR